MRTVGLVLATLLGFAAIGVQRAAAATQELVLDPAASAIGFSLGATLHTVEGQIALTSGRIRFDPDGGPAQGEVVLDAQSARTGLAARDRNLHRDVLESEAHPRIVFRPETLRVLERDRDQATVELAGALELHGRSRPLVVPARVRRDGERLAIDARFPLRWLDWGLRDPSTWLLRVEPSVTVTLRAEGQLVTPP